MLKFKHLIVVALLALMPLQLFASNMSPVISYLLSDSKPVLSDDEKWFDGKKFYSFWIEDDDNETEIGYGEIELSDGNIIEKDYLFGGGVWMLEAYQDLVLNTTTGAWEAEFQTYEIDSNNENIANIDGMFSIRIDSVVDLSGLTVPISNGLITIPVTFSSGAKKYNISEKNLVEVYELDYTPTRWDENGDTGQPYTSLESYMNQGGCFYYDEETQTCVDAERNMYFTNAVDSSGDNITTISLGDTGNLVVVDWAADPITQTIVGTWEAINLPGQSTITIDTNLNPDISNYMGAEAVEDKHLATMHEGVVKMVGYEPAMADYEVDDEDYTGNLQAVEDFKAAVEAFYAE